MKNFTISSLFFLLLFLAFSQSDAQSSCSWYNRKPYYSFWDSCSGKAHKYSLNGYIGFGVNMNCLKFQWTVDGNYAGTGRYVTYPISSNGTYDLCVKVTDTCNNCDTVFCSKRVITCVNACNWASRKPYTSFWDSCTGKVHKYSLNGYVYFGTSMSCYKFQWTVNGHSAGTGHTLSYPITANGTYNLCVKVTDTCNNCDTSFCSSRLITCISSCNWNNKKPYFSFWDSCSGKVHPYSINGYIGFGTSMSCFKFQWTVNGSYAGTGRYLTYPISKNGTYNLCVKVTDTCNNCDTSICSSRLISCINSCTWYNKKPYYSFWDSCSGKVHKYSLNGYVYFGSGMSCYKFQWTVNGSLVGSGHTLSYPISTNGTYNLCVKVIDTCNNCDTTFCSSRVISCISSCHWYDKKPYYSFWDSCSGKAHKYSLNGYVYFGTSMSCFKYQWTVNGYLVGTGRYLTYPIAKNGTYNLCIKVIDTCNSCDTTFCSSRLITCISSCNWYSRKPYFNFWDSCTGKAHPYSINGYIGFQTSLSCYKFQWSVNGYIVGTGRIFSYPVTKNGVYNLCVKVIDTCNNCDTTFCSSRHITCISSCNWYSRKPFTNFWDSCEGKVSKYSLNGYIGFQTSLSCLKFQWSVNGHVVGTGRWITYPIYSNGTYNLCVKVTDTCNNCDTSFCSSRVIHCISTCSWYSRKEYGSFWDSCSGKVHKYSINGYIGFQTSLSCFNFQWSVNGNPVGTGRWFTYPITKNGTYNLCVKVTDTCNNCDTSYCSSRVINCIPSGINDGGDLSNVLKVWPNPTDGSVWLSLNAENGSFILTNTSGQKLFTGKLSKGEQNLDLSIYPSGLYFLQVQTANGLYIQKIFLQKN